MIVSPSQSPTLNLSLATAGHRNKGHEIKDIEIKTRNKGHIEIKEIKDKEIKKGNKERK